MTGQDQAQRDAVAAMTRRFRQLDAPNPDVLALEVMQMLIGRGWRHVPARPPAPWKADPGRPLPADAVREHAAAVRASLHNPPEPE